MKEGKYERAEPGSHVGTAITFLLIGLGAGALLGFVYGPKAGKQVRKKLRRQIESARGILDDWTGDAKDLAEEAVGRGINIAEEIKEKVAPLLDQIRRTRS